MGAGGEIGKNFLLVKMGCDYSNYVISTFLLWYNSIPLVVSVLLFSMLYYLLLFLLMKEMECPA